MSKGHFIIEYKWSCCSCWQHGGMDTLATLFCPNANCLHRRCSNCSIEEVKRYKERLSGGLCGYINPFGSTADRPHPEDKETELSATQSLGRHESPGSFEFESSSREKIWKNISSQYRILIPVVPAGQEDDPIYSLDPVEDAALLDQWNTVVLATISAKPDDFSGFNAIHLFRRGNSENNSSPTIIVSMEDITNQKPLHDKLSRLIEPPLRNNCQILFEESKIRRTVRGLFPPICEPRNIGYTPHPDFGASVGLKGKVDSTATLGGYLVVDNRLLLMTVDHLIGDNDIPPVLLTHPSEQEALFSKYWPMLDNALNLLKECCICCQTIYREHCRPERCYSPILESSLLPRCEMSSSFRDTKEFLVKACPRETFGSLVCRSMTRSRPSQVNDKYNTEMDWALFHTDQWPESLGLPANEKARNLRFSEIVPGAKVTATGRTSGNQLGIISTAMSIIRHGTRITQEWTVLRDPNSTLEDWIKGGIGVDGDSGAWILDRESGAIYGMVWGRNYPSTKPICLFSPIEDIVVDIKERTGAIEVCLPGQETRAIRTTPIKEHQVEEKEVHGKGKGVFIDSSYQGASSARY